MYIMNGIVYGGTPNDTIKISDVKVLPDKILLITFSTGETRLFDATVLTGEVYAPLNNNNILNTITIDHGVITWLDGEIDCAPEFMYKHSYEYSTIEAV